MDLPQRRTCRCLSVQDIRLVFSTFPDDKTARRIATELVTGRFAACANVLPHIESIYRWQDKVETAEETLVLFKLAASRYQEFESKLKSLHPYDVPEIIAVELTNGLPAYLQWAIENSN
jgi:periplasmic divalent cation tolerance protein